MTDCYGEPESGCLMCRKHGTGNGLLYVSQPTPGIKPGYHHQTAPRLVSGMLRCECNPKMGEESRTLVWLEGWRENMDWHRFAIDCIQYEPEKKEQWRQFESMRALAHDALGAIT